MLIAEELTYSIIGASHEVFKQLGFGFREHVYIKALERELRARGHRVAREVSVVVMYKGEELTTERMDMLVDDQVVVETKSTARLDESASRQLYNYLRATRIEVGLLLHFGVKSANHFRIISSNPSSIASPSKVDEGLV